MMKINRLSISQWFIKCVTGNNTGCMALANSSVEHVLCFNNAILGATLIANEDIANDRDCNWNLKAVPSTNDTF